MRFRYTTSLSVQFCLFLGALTISCGSSDGGGTASTHIGQGGSVSAAVGGAGGSVVGGASAKGTGGSGPGTGATGGSSPRATGGSPGSGGSSAVSSNFTQGGSVYTGGTATTGGSSMRGGSSSVGGSRTTGGSQSSGGTQGAGGTRTTGGSSAVAGNRTTGGSSGVAGGRASGGNVATGGLSNVGGSSSDSTGTDGCTDTLALGVTLDEVAVFQSGKISVMKSGAEVAASTTYGADIVEGRPTLFRAYVTVDSGFSSRQLSARLVLNDGSTTYFSKQTINASSTELNLANSFPISVPASVINTGLNYSIKIVECGTGSGTAHNPEFPQAGQANLVTRLTGPIKITVVPVTTNNITPTLDSTFSSRLEQVFDAMYPTSDTQITVSSTPITGCTITPSTAGNGTAWSNCLDLVRSRRTADRPASDVYYLGILTPATTLAGYCGSSCIAGISFEATATGASGRASLAIGYLPQALDTCAHELGHAHGLAHSPGCNASSADTKFPYVVNGKAYIGWAGWDNRTPTTILNPATVTDIMAYCTPQWVSDYVYSKWEDRVATVNGAASMIGVEASAWRVLYVVDGVAHWGQPIVYPEVPSGDAESAAALDLEGQTVQEITVYRTNISVDAPNAVSAASYMIPEPANYWSYVQIGDIVAKFQ